MSFSKKKEKKNTTNTRDSPRRSITNGGGNERV